jgi:phosphoethanolamine N-methyltransferase
MSPSESAKIGRPGEPGEYDEGMLALLQIIWGEGFLSPGGADELARILEGSDIAGCQVLDIGCGQAI